MQATNKGFDAVERAEKDAAIIKAAASNNGVDPNVLAAIGVRESGWRNVPELRGGQGAGIFQIDLGEHRDAAGIAYNPPLAANYAAGLLASNYAYFGNRYGVSGAVGWAYAIRGYNFWNSGRVPPEARVLAGLGVYGLLDYRTKGQNYVTNVLGLANCFNF